MVKWFTRQINFRKGIVALMTAFLLFSLESKAQQYPGFSDKVIAELNTADNTSYLTPDEKELILLMNMVRHDGSTFWEKLAAPYIQQNEIPATRYTRSLEKDLRATPRLVKLAPHKTLFDAAKKHAVASGKAGDLGHDSTAGTFEERLTPLRSEFNYLLENCDYGSSKAMDILMNLMIDEGIPDVGHRKNILSDKVDAVGVSIAPHKTYRFTSVQVFGLIRNH
jgi:hypothetical protein